MAYCLACGKLADTHGGFCSQCAVDMQAARPKPKRVKVNRYANGNERRKVRRWLKDQGRPCHLCGGAIDYSLPSGHPMSFEVDEIVPVSKGGSPIDPSNVAPAHRICNERRGNKSLDSLNAPPKPRAKDVGCKTSFSW